MRSSSVLIFGETVFLEVIITLGRFLSIISGIIFTICCAGGLKLLTEFFLGQLNNNQLLWGIITILLMQNFNIATLWKVIGQDFTKIIELLKRKGAEE